MYSHEELMSLQTRVVLVIVLVIKHVYSAIKSADSEVLCYRSWDKLKSAIEQK
jgi:hypothetical protein